MNKPIMTINGRGIFKEGREFVARRLHCPECGGPCSIADTRANTREVRRMINGKLFGLPVGRTVTYPTPKSVKVGCTEFRRSRLLKLLEKKS